MRVTCEADGFDAWVDIAPRFTRRDVERFVEADEDTTIAMIRERLTACHIPLNDGTVITDADGFTGERLQEADILIVAWLGELLPRVIGHQRTLGKASSRLSSGNNGTATAATMTTTTTNSANLTT